MAFSVSSLTNYVIQNEKLLLSISHFDGVTQQLILNEGNLRTDIKSSEKIGIISTDVVFQSDSSCAFNPSGTTSITQRDLVVGKVKVEEQFCVKDLEPKYTQKANRPGGSSDYLTFEEEIMGEKARIISEQIETALWQGDTASPTNNLSYFDGLIKQIDAASGSTIAINASGYLGTAAVSSAITASNVISIVNAAWKAIPASVKGKSDVRIFCGWDTFELCIAAYIALNLYHYDADRTPGVFIIPGTQYKLTAVHGLDGTNRLFSLRMSNIVLGTDLDGEETRFELWYSQDDRVMKFSTRFKMGVNIVFPTEVAQFLLK